MDKFLFKKSGEPIPVGVSARHLHVSREDLDILFGKDYELTVMKELKQPGQYASNETVRIEGTKGAFPKVRILGPIRKSTQVEISKTDCITLGLGNNVPIRESGYLSDSASVKIIGPNGTVELKEGVIVAKRHIHMAPSDAEKYGVENGQIVSVLADTEERKTIFSDVVVRVRDDFWLEFHVDTDEANAACLATNDNITLLIEE